MAGIPGAWAAAALRFVAQPLFPAAWREARGDVSSGRATAPRNHRSEYLEEAPGSPPEVALGRFFFVDAALGRVRGRDLLDGVERVHPARLELVRYELGRRRAFYSLGVERVGVEAVRAVVSVELEPRHRRGNARREYLGGSAVEAVLAGRRGRAGAFVGLAAAVLVHDHGLGEASF